MTSTLLFRLSIAFITATVVVACSLDTQSSLSGKYDAGYFGLLIIQLVPIIIFLLALRDERCTLICGGLLVTLTPGAWLLYYLYDKDAIVLSSVILAFLVTLSANIVCMASGHRGST